MAAGSHGAGWAAVLYPPRPSVLTAFFCYVGLNVFVTEDEEEERGR